MILVTGGTGFLGAHLLYKLVSQNEQVRAIRRAGSSFDLVKKIFTYYSGNKSLFDKIEWFEADLLDADDLNEAFSDVEYVYHAAAGVSYDPRDKEKLYETNVIGTANIVDACIDNNIKKLCHVSSIAALGETGGDPPIDEKTLWEDDGLNSGYSISKYNSELEAWRGVVQGLDTIIVNPSVILGYNNWENGSSALYTKIAKGFSYYTMGSSGFVDVEDVCNIMIGLMKSDIVNESYIISAENICYKDLFEKLAQSINAKVPSKYATPFLTGMAWRMDYTRSKLLGKPALLTKQSARTSHKKLVYTNEKIRAAIDYKFKPVDETIKELGVLFLKENGK